ncbi:GNAT family N-acetyltransferase [Ureibacillus acetophenoni]|uniref:L-amino acid N-acyltransferase YncA n=1 Tax=Ureibacillus acetophenoni TaxID=614649 RepID=A0A285UI29_9BACL|nr:GNAT family N-acetyltransferase [Ureibacillus acetophenoni]SOC41519.1 L-amino acid N-acyltransferase YncA [Ureibacillus acetophenoni]
MSTINSNTKIYIRTGRLDDAEAVLAVQNSVISEGEYLITVTEEFNKTPAQQREWIKKLIENDRETLIVAEANGELVGWIVFLCQNRLRLAHTGSFGMMILKNYRGMGIGKMLLKALLEWAERNPLIEKVSLGVFSTNHRAISLYKSMGFVEEGRKIKEIKLNENEYVDDILMYKWV